MGKGCEASPALLQKALDVMPFLRELAMNPTSNRSWQTLLPSLTLSCSSLVDRPSLQVFKRSSKSRQLLYVIERSDARTKSFSVSL